MYSHHAVIAFYVERSCCRDIFQNVLCIDQQKVDSVFICCIDAVKVCIRSKPGFADMLFVFLRLICCPTIPVLLLTSAIPGNIPLPSFPSASRFSIIATYQIVYVIWLMAFGSNLSQNSFHELERMSLSLDIELPL